jgi:MoaA/NifB/PqqE/SkfB family radical SAM enzyme
MSSCQLRCPTCPTTTGAIRSVIPAGYLKASAFDRFLERNPGVRSVELSNWGEILLNPEFVEILRVAHERGVDASADNGLNLNTASDEQLDAMVRYRFRSATFSIDGASSETYRMYRVRGDFDRVITHLRKLAVLKRARNSDRPRLAWQFVVFGHNEHELPRARALAADLGMVFRPKLSYEEGFSPVRDREFVRRQMGAEAASRAEYEARKGVHYLRSICLQLWNEPQINWDGKVLGCCVNYWEDLGGNAFEQGLDGALAHEKMGHARRMLLGMAPPREDIPCTTCDVYRAMAREDRWLTLREVAAGRSRLVNRLRRIPVRRFLRRLLGRG